ncbi:MAG: hypothetical protein AAF497_10330 [Planctomycetota bacterium]
MSTTLDIVNGALRRIQLIGVTEVASAAEAADALKAINGMMGAWGPQYDLDYTHTTLALDDAFPIAGGLHDGFEAMLAVRVASSYGASNAVPNDVREAALEGWRLIEATYYKDVKSDVDTGLKWTPGQRRYGWTAA